MMTKPERMNSPLRGRKRSAPTSSDPSKILKISVENEGKDQNFDTETEHLIKKLNEGKGNGEDEKYISEELLYDNMIKEELIDQERLNSLDYGNLDTSSQKRVNQIKCKICHAEVKFYGRQPLYKHYTTHFKEEMNEVNKGFDTQCSICGKEIPNKNSLLVHISVIHNRIESLLPEDMKYDYIMTESSMHVIQSDDNMLSELDNRNTKLRPIFAKLIEKLGCSQDKVSIMPNQLIDESSNCFIMCYHCDKLLIGVKSRLQRHIAGHYMDEILSFPDKGTCSFCSVNPKATKPFALHYATEHGIGEQVIPWDQWNFLKISDILELSNPGKEKNDLFTPEISRLISKLDWSEDKVVRLYSRDKDPLFFLTCSHCQMLVIGAKDMVMKHLYVHYKDEILTYPLLSKCNTCERVKTYGPTALLVHVGTKHGVAERVIPKEEWNFTTISDFLDPTGGENKKKTNPEISSLVSKLGWPEEKVKKLYSRDKDPLFFLICLHCQKLMIGAKDVVIKHVISHYKDQILSVPEFESCKVCEKFRKRTQPTEFAVHLALKHKVAEMLIPKNQLMCVKITDFLDAAQEDFDSEQENDLMKSNKVEMLMKKIEMSQSTPNKIVRKVKHVKIPNKDNHDIKKELVENESDEIAVTSINDSDPCVKKEPVEAENDETTENVDVANDFDANDIVDKFTNNDLMKRKSMDLSAFLNVEIQD